MKFLRSKRGLAALAALLLLLFLFRPGVYRLRDRISGSIGSALGRRVTIDNVRVHFLPRPGFDLEGLVIYDDPEFSSEPMVRAQEVSAALRLRSLLRGRLEISNLNATEPSINLVRSENGRWNLVSLLERSAQISTSPARSQTSVSRPSFPYLEASAARVNFKVGQEKKSWALTDADLALWQDSENGWGARLAAQPMRTDMNVSDTGQVRVNANWQRGSIFADTPLQVELEWRRGQLGQITKLFSGRDRGWRGAVTLAARFSGTPAALQIQSQLQIDDFRRYDLMTAGSVRLATACSGEYTVIEQAFKNVACESPIGSGSVRLRGNVGPTASSPAYDVTLTVEKVPLSSAMGLLRRVKQGLPDDLSAAGRIDGIFRAARQNSSGQISGKGSISGVRLAANDGKDQIVTAEIPLVLTSREEKRARTISQRMRAGPAEAQLSMGPFSMSMGSGGPINAAGWLSMEEFQFTARGDTDIRNLYHAASTLGIPGFRPVAEGFARIDLSYSGSWRGFAAPTVLGTAQLRNVRTGMRGLNPAIEIGSATIRLDADHAILQQLSARTGDTTWSGSVTAPRSCAGESCVFHFDLAADRISSDGLAQWFTARPAKRPWYKILGSGEPSGKSPLLAIQANGKLRIRHFAFKDAGAGQIVTRMELNRGKMTFSELRGQIFQGTCQGRLVIDASTQPPRYQASGALQNVSMAQVSTAMRDEWATGTADGQFHLTSSGANFVDLLANADGEVKFELENGTLPHLELPEAAKPFPVHLFAGRVQVKNGTWNLSAGRIESRDGIYQIRGTASSGSGLNMVLTRGDEQSWNITGTLAKPHLTTRALAEARSIVK